MIDDTVKGSRARVRPGWVRLACAVGVIALTVGVAWRTSSLDGLPDIGDPFDVEAYCRPIPDETNAFVLYREATARLGKYPQNLKHEWEIAGESERKWLEESREALAIWRRGTERPDALYIPPRELTAITQLPVIQQLRTFTWLAQLEGSRLESEGDLEGALDWYLAILRSSRHSGQRGLPIERLVGIAIHQAACDRITRWSKRPEVATPALRRALDSIVAIDARTPVTSDVFKAEYVSFLHTIEDPAFHDPASWESDLTAKPEAPAGSLRAALGQSFYSLARIVKKEPERSRRVYRLIIANMLAGCDLPPSKRPSPYGPYPTSPGLDPVASLLAGLYDLDPADSAKAKVIPPRDLARWFASTIYARNSLPSFGTAHRALARERSTHATLVIHLANTLYERDHGKPAESVETLVGHYLKSLPETGTKP